MNYDLSQEQKKLQGDISRLCKEKIAARAAELDACGAENAAKMIRENVRMLGEAGFLGLGGDLVGQCASGEEVAKACASTFHSAWSSAYLAGALINLYGTGPQKAKYLPEIAKGALIAAFAYSEDGAGSDVSGIAASAGKSDGGWIINGEKNLVTNAPVADAFIVLAWTDRDAGAEKGMSLFIIDKPAAGLAIGTPAETLGLKGAPVAGVRFSDLKTADDALLGGAAGRGLAQTTHILEIARLGMATLAIGIGMSCMEKATMHAKTRKAFGKKIGTYQEVGFKLADMFTYNDLGRMLIYKAAWAFEESDPEAAILAACAKLFTGENVTNIANWAMQIFAGHGYVKGSDIERLYRDARFCEIGCGTSEIMRITIARDVLDRNPA